AGSVVCLDRHTGKVAWKFEADDDLKAVFCTPTAAGGKVYFGEGLHDSKPPCRFFCLDAATGKPAWEKPFEAGSHNEGTPLVLGDRVVFPAGDDGLICADAKTGAPKWRVGGKDKGLHTDGPPASDGKRLFAGSGLYSTVLLGLDADTGRELWRTPVPLRSFGRPLVLGDTVVYGLGTGNLME